jgi:hypothetical protein
LQNHIPAFSPVAAVGAPAGNKFFTAKAAAAFSSISAFYEDFCLIDKFDGSNLAIGSGSSQKEREG